LFDSPGSVGLGRDDCRLKKDAAVLILPQKETPVRVAGRTTRPSTSVSTIRRFAITPMLPARKLRSDDRTEHQLDAAGVIGGSDPLRRSSPFAR